MKAWKDFPKEYWMYWVASSLILPKATLTVREGYGHCRYLSSMGESYSGILEQYIHEGDI